MSTRFTADLIVGWTLSAVCIVLTAVRYALRKWVLRMWYWDDVAHGVALILFITEVAIVQASLPILNSVSDKNNHLPLDEKYRSYRQIDIADSICGVSIYWVTKVAFLMFYRLVFKTQKGFLRAWWIILGYTVLTYWVYIALTLTVCGGSASHVLQESVCLKQSDSRAVFIVIYCMNVSSDLAIMILPLICVSSLQISLQRKLGVSVLFCVGLVIIAFESLRLAMSIDTTVGADNTLWGFLEAAACIIASCMPTFAALKVWRRNGYRSSSSAYGYRLRSGQRITNPPHRPAEYGAWSQSNVHDGDSLKAPTIPQPVMQA